MNIGHIPLLAAIAAASSVAWAAPAIADFSSEFNNQIGRLETKARAAANLVDGDNLSAWEVLNTTNNPKTTASWVTIDLGSDQQVSSVLLSFVPVSKDEYHAALRPRQISVGLAPASNYKPGIAPPGPPAEGDPARGVHLAVRDMVVPPRDDTVSIPVNPPTTARYVRVIIPSNPTGNASVLMTDVQVNPAAGAAAAQSALASAPAAAAASGGPALPSPGAVSAARPAVPSLVDAPAVQWETDYRAALAKAAPARKKVLILFVSPGADSSEALEQAFADARAQSVLSTGHIPVKVNVTAQPDVAKRLGVTQGGIVILYDAAGQPLKQISGARTVDQLLQELH